MKVIVVIANYGFRNKTCLEQLIAEYRSMPIDVSIVVLSNVDKDFNNDIEVQVGLPTKNPWSLPFAHRSIFRERIDEYDYFIYSEDDTLLRWSTFRAFIELSKNLEENEIVGFLRTEKSKTGQLYYSTCHSHFRWIPSTIKERGGLLWAKYSNEHSALFVASQKQLRSAVVSGGFSTRAHEDKYDMLCSAANDIYTNCGFERLLCIDRIKDFALPHLPNKYIGKLGLPEEELEWQIDALRKIYKAELSEEELFNPETRMHGFAGSKRLREEKDPVIQEMLDHKIKSLLVWGAGDGYFESSLKSLGFDVSVYPINAVLGECCRRRGLTVIPVGRTLMDSYINSFDAVIMRDVLHLVQDPESTLKEVMQLLRSGGSIIISVPNFFNYRNLKNSFKKHKHRFLCFFDKIGARPFTKNSLRREVERAGFSDIIIKENVSKRFLKFNKLFFGLFSQPLSLEFYLKGKKEK